MKQKTVISKIMDNIKILLSHHITHIENNKKFDLEFSCAKDMLEYKDFCIYLLEKLLEKNIFSYMVVVLLIDRQPYDLYKYIKSQNADIKSYLVRLLATDDTPSLIQVLTKNQAPYLKDAKFIQVLDRLENHLLVYINCKINIPNINFDELENASKTLSKIIMLFTDESLSKKLDVYLKEHELIQYLDELLSTPHQIDKFIINITDVLYNTKDKNMDYIDLFYEFLDNFKLNRK